MGNPCCKMAKQAQSFKFEEGLEILILIIVQWKSGIINQNMICN